MAKRSAAGEPDGVYLLKLVLYLILGASWLKISKGQTLQVPIPIGFAAGLIFAAHEHFQLDKKIEYALLLAAMLIGFWLPIGLYVGLP